MLSEWLEKQFTPLGLKRVASMVGLKLKGTPPHLSSVIASAMLGIDRGRPLLAKLFDKLDAVQQAFVREALYQRPASVNSALFYLRYGSVPEWAPKAGRGELGWLHLFVAEEERAYPSKLMAEEMAERLEKLLPPPPPDEMEPVDHPAPRDPAEPLTVHLSEAVALQELPAVLAMIASTALPSGALGAKPKPKALAAFNSALIDGDFSARWAGADSAASNPAAIPIRAVAWETLLRAAKLADSNSYKLELTGKGQDALRQPVAATLKQIWEAWLEFDDFNELLRIPSLPDLYSGYGLVPPSARRQAIAQALKTCPVNAWILTVDFFRHLMASGIKLKVFQQRMYYGFSLSDDAQLREATSWLHYQGSIILALLFEHAATLGMVDIAFHLPTIARQNRPLSPGARPALFPNQYDGLVAFRITPLGAYALGLQPAYAPQAIDVTGKLRFLPELVIEAVDGRFDYGIAAILSRFGKRLSPSQFQLAMAVALASLENGGHAHQLGLLLERSGALIPPEMQAFIGDLDRRAGMLAVAGQSRLFECASEAMAIDIAFEWKTQFLCKMAGPTTLSVPLRSEASFRDMMRELGYPICRNQPPGTRKP